MEPPAPTPVRDEGFEQALEDRPDDRGLRLVYADWLEERGEDARAATHRWLADRGLHPVRCRMEQAPYPTVYVLGSPLWLQFAEFGPARLPDDVADAVRRRLDPPEDLSIRRFADLAAGRRPPFRLANGAWVYFHSPEQAVSVLAAALAEVG